MWIGEVVIVATAVPVDGVAATSAGVVDGVAVLGAGCAGGFSGTAGAGFVSVGCAEVAGVSIGAVLCSGVAASPAGFFAVGSTTGKT